MSQRLDPPVSLARSLSSSGRRTSPDRLGDVPPVQYCLGFARRPESSTDGEQLGGDRDGGRVDLQLQVGDDAGDLKRVWIEAKLFARFQRRGHGATQVHQLVGYRRALNRYDRRRYRAAAPASSLVALVHSIDRGVDRIAVRVSQTQPITWQMVADLVGEYGVKTYGPDWRQRSSERDSSRGLATLETLVWFLEDAPAPDGTNM